MDNESNVVTLGNASRIIPLNCRNKILIDSTQIDFIPYSPSSIPKLKEIMENIYGLDFFSRDKTSEIMDIPSIPSGSIEQNLVNKSWSTRSIKTWEFLSCKFNFRYLVIPSEIKIMLKPILEEEGLNLYELNPICRSKFTGFIGDFINTLPLEYDENKIFYWLTDQPSTLYFRNLNSEENYIELKLKLTPNPCKNEYSTEIQYENQIYYLITGKQSRELIIKLSPNVGTFQRINFVTRSSSQKCDIQGEKRTLVTKVTDIKFN